MSKTLTVLIKLAERKVETIQQALSHTYKALDAVKNDIRQCERDAADAFLDAVGDDDVLTLQAASAFQERMRRQLIELNAMQQHLEAIEAEQKKQLQDAFAEQKRYEILHERQLAAAKKLRAKKAQETLDDLSQRRNED